MIIGLIALLISLYNTYILKSRKNVGNKVVNVVEENKSTIIEKVAEEKKEIPTTNFISPRFPMVFGQKGDKIKELQKVILKIDPNALPKYGVDGNLDNETTNALTSLIGKGFIKDESDWNKLIALIP